MGALRLQDAVVAEVNARGVHEEDAEKQASELQKQIETRWKFQILLIFSIFTLFLGEMIQFDEYFVIFQTG